jgi:outer membrane receptor protein involved in Fe transport
VTLTSFSTGEQKRTASDAAGTFTFVGVRAGTYRVAANVPGFRPREAIVTVEPRAALAVTLALEVAPLDVRVTVTADSRPLTATHSPSSTVLTAERLAGSAAFQRTNLPDAIVTAAPGMIRGHDDFVHIRGHEIALNPLIDGVAFWENTHALFSAGFSPEVIETANVMTGGFPAEYGNRFGGVVDIVTKSGLRMDHRGEVAFSAGGAGRLRGTAEIGGRRGALGYYTFGSLFESDRFLSPPDPVAIHDRGRGADAFVSIDRRLESYGELKFVVAANGTNVQIPKRPLDVELRPAANADLRTRQQTFVAGWNRAWISTAIGVSAYQRWSRLELEPATGPLTARAALNRELLTIGGKAEITRAFGRHVVKAGLDAVRLRPEERLDYDYAGYNALTHLLGLPHIHITNQRITFAGRDSGGQISAFAQDRIALGPRVTIDVGVRVDRYALVVTDTHASPRVNVAFAAGRGVIVHGSYNRFFVPPAVEGVLSSSAGLTAAIREIGKPMPALEPTVEDQVETGAVATMGPVQVGLTAYYRASDNPVHTTVWPDSRIYSYASFDRGRAHGVEVKAELPGLARYGLTAQLNYATGRVYFYNPVTGGFITEAEHLTDTNRFVAPMDQTHTLTGAMIWRHARTGLWLGAAIEYGSGTPIGHGAAHDHGAGEDHDHGASGDALDRVAGHVTGNLSLGIDLLRDAASQSRLMLRLDVENVTNRDYVIARESQFSPAQYSIPRLISATLRVRF